jgi:transmission-blocking target antigen S230
MEERLDKDNESYLDELLETIGQEPPYETNRRKKATARAKKSKMSSADVTIDSLDEEFNLDDLDDSFLDDVDLDELISLTNADSGKSGQKAAEVNLTDSEKADNLDNVETATGEVEDTQAVKEDSTLGEMPEEGTYTDVGEAPVAKAPSDFDEEPALRGLDDVADENQASSEEDVETAEEIGDEIGSELGVELGEEIGTETGSDVGEEIGTEIGEEIGTEIGTEIGDETGTGIGAEAEPYDSGAEGIVPDGASGDTKPDDAYSESDKASAPDINALDDIGAPEVLSDKEIASNKSSKKGKTGKKGGDKKGLFSVIFQKLFANVPLTEEEIAAIPTPEQEEAAKKEKEAEAAKKKEDKKAAAEADKKKKAEEAKKKAADNKAKKAAKDAAKKAAKKEAELKRLRAEALEQPEGKINKAGATIILLFFVVAAAVVIIGTNIFSYDISIADATHKFGNHKYTEAYEGIRGLDIKEKDMLIHDKIYTVMFVNKQLNSYNNFFAMGDYSSALDSLIKGLSRYDKYIALARQLGIHTDLDYVRKQIMAELQSVYGVDEREALELMDMTDRQDYSERIYAIVSKLDTKAIEAEKDKDELVP